MARDRVEVVVVGAGFAGASAAYHLCRAGVRDVLVLEREPTPGRHASGRNAALADLAEPDPVQAPLIEEGVRFLHDPPGPAFATALLRATGSLRLGSRAELEALRRAADSARCGRTSGADAGRGGRVSGLEEIPIDEAIERVPLLAGVRAEAALWCEAGGVVDIHALLQGYLRGIAAGGGSLRCGAPVTGVRRGRGGTFEVDTPQGRVETPVVVNAAGAWALDVARMAGASAMPLTSYRRHLFQSAPVPGLDPGWPFVWDETREYYFRPESGGLLLSPCDRTPHPAGEPAEDLRAREILAEKLAAAAPRLAALRLARGWACLRTFALDSRFVIGEDPGLEGFFWVAGLGGSGMMASVAVGRLAAQAVLGALPAGGAGEALSPARFARGGAE